MKPYLSEKSIVVVLFILVMVSFSLAHEDSKKAEKLFTHSAGASVERLLADQGPDPVRAD